MRFEEISEEDFAKVDYGLGNFLQSVEMWHRYQAIGREALLLGVKTEYNEVLAVGLVTVRPWRLGKKIWRVAGGWVMDYDADNYKEILAVMTEGVRKLARERGAIVVEISPRVVAQTRDINGVVAEGPEHLGVAAELERLGYKYLGEYEQPKWEFVLGLTGKTEEGLIGEMRTTHRQLIRKAEREGVRVRELGLDELEVLKMIAEEAGERHGFKDPEVDYYRSMGEAFGEKVKFVVAEAPRELLAGENLAALPMAEEVDGVVKAYVPLAAAMFVDDGREMVYLYSGSLRKLQKYNGAYAIQWEMIRRALKEGLPYYNFYGTHPVAENGVFKFKQGFRGEVVERLGTFALPTGWLGKLYLSRIRTEAMREVA